MVHFGIMKTGNGTTFTYNRWDIMPNGDMNMGMTKTAQLTKQPHTPKTIIMHFYEFMNFCIISVVATKWCDGMLKIKY